MTAKRFIEFMTQSSDDSEINYGFRDIIGEEWYYTKDRVTGKKIVDLLNELHEENQSLKFQLDECRNNKLFSRRQLEKENEQLKRTIKTIKNILFDLKEIESYWDSSILQNVIDNIAEIVGVDLDD